MHPIVTCVKENPYVSLLLWGWYHKLVANLKQQGIPSNTLRIKQVLYKKTTEVTTQYFSKKKFILGIKELGNRSVEQYLARIKQVLYIKLANP